MKTKYKFIWIRHTEKNKKSIDNLYQLLQALE